MGNGARHDAIEDKVDHLNFEKNVGQGRFFVCFQVMHTLKVNAQGTRWRGS
jgi:hypothetical protein